LRRARKGRRHATSASSLRSDLRPSLSQTALLRGAMSAPRSAPARRSCRATGKRPSGASRGGGGRASFRPGAGTGGRAPGQGPNSRRRQASPDEAGLAAPRGAGGRETAADLEATRADVPARQAVAREVEDRPEDERRESRSAGGAGCGTGRHLQRDDHGCPFLADVRRESSSPARRVQDTYGGRCATAPILTPPESGLCRLAGDRDELQVRGELAVEPRSAAPADRPSRLLTHELLAATRAAALSELLQIGLHLHNWNGRTGQRRRLRRKG
jgi:hypothetical protein